MAGLVGPSLPHHRNSIYTSTISLLDPLSFLRWGLGQLLLPNCLLRLRLILSNLVPHLPLAAPFTTITNDMVTQLRPE